MAEKTRSIFLLTLTLALLVTLSLVPSAWADYTDFTEIVWTRVENQHYADAEGQAVVFNHRLYSFGGFDALKPCCTPTRRAYYYDPSLDEWTPIADMPAGLTNAGIDTDGQYIYYAGGYIENASQTGQIFGTDKVWRYDPVLNVYSDMPKMPKRNSTGQMVYLSGYLHYIGGTTPDTRAGDLSDHYIFNLEAFKTNPNEKWVDITAVAPLPNPRHQAGAVVLNGKIYYVGGQKGQNGQLSPQKSVHYFDPGTNIWTQVADMPGTGLNHINSTVVLGGRIIVMGGQGYSGQYVNTVLAYSPVTNSWSNLTPLPMVQAGAIGGTIDNTLYFSGGLVNGDTTLKYKKATHRGVPVILEPTDTATVTGTDTETPTHTPTFTDTLPPTATATETASAAALTSTPTLTLSGTLLSVSPIPTNSATYTAIPTATHTATPTVTPTATHTATHIATSTLTPVPTATAVNEGIELLTNGSFEVDHDGDQVPDHWMIKNQTGDRMLCKPGSVFDGRCAFRFKGGIQEDSILSQKIDLGDITFMPGDTLHLSGYLNASSQPTGSFILTVKYHDGTPQGKIKIEMLSSSGVYQGFSGDLSLISGSLAKIKMRIQHTSPNGKVLVDGVSVALFR